MADEKPNKPRKTTTRAPRKRADSPAANAAANVGGAAERETRSAETPMLAIEQSSEVNGPVADEIDEIRREAYVLYLSRGSNDGNDLSDWLEAERIVRQRRGGETADRSSR